MRAGTAQLWECTGSSSDAYREKQGPFLHAECCFRAVSLSDGASPPTCCLAFHFFVSDFASEVGCPWLGSLNRKLKGL